MVLAMAGGWTAVIVALRDAMPAPVIAMPWPARALGGVLGVASCVLAIVADRQLGLRVRAGLPYFEEGSRIRLRMRGACAIVRQGLHRALTARATA